MSKMSFKEYADTLPIDKDNVENLKSQMRAAVEDKKLRDVRKSLALTQKQLASKIGVAQNRISDIENGRIKSLRIDTLLRYAHALGFDIDIFLRPHESKESGNQSSEIVKLSIG